MDTLFDFFRFRPVFTVFGLKVLWYAYLLNTVLQTYINTSTILATLAQRGIAGERGGRISSQSSLGPSYSLRSCGLAWKSQRSFSPIAARIKVEVSPI